MPNLAQIWLGVILSHCLLLTAAASPVLGPGDMQLRHDLEFLNDSGVINIPLTAWPLAAGDLRAALDNVEYQPPTTPVGLVLSRVRERLRRELDIDSINVGVGISGSYNPRIIRSFENTPRDEGEAKAELTWLGERFSVNLAATYVANPLDEDEFRPDGTYLGVALGNWMLTAGWQDRWWGPGRDGSLILSTNARPTPGVAIQRNNSVPFETKWLSWMGPWTFTSFMNLLDDERVVEDGLLFGMRGSFRPLRGLEIGISRTAQWCGDGRPCDLKTFLRVLNGNDNRGANVDPEDEPGNQLGGFDIRWTLPEEIPVALYMQWIAEDTRKTGAQLHQWLEQVGVEYWGMVGDMSHRTHLEVVNSSCHLGALGEGSEVSNCAYNHSIFRSGYRYFGRSIGFSGDGDTLSYSIGSTLVQSAGHSWNISLRYMDINRIGPPDPRHSLTPTPLNLTDIQISHDRETRLGRFHVGLGYSHLDDEATDVSDSEVTAFFQWSSN
jgi:hypothetical protein